MDSPIDAPLVSPIVVGRAPYLTAVAERLDALRAGRGDVLLIAGEAGIGKTRLVRELRADAESRGLRVLTAACFEPDRGLPHALLLGLARAHLASRPRDPLAGILAALAPEFTDLAPGAGPTAQPVAIPEAAREQHRFAQAWRQLVEAVAAQPAVIVVEDAHWADDASLDALHAVARQTAARPLLLALTYRTDEVSPSLRRLLANLDRDRLASELTLPRLSLPEVDAMLRAVFDQPRPIRAEFLRAIHDLTDGNPFFIEEVIRALVAAGDIYRANGRWERRALTQLRIPRSVQDAVQRHGDRLSPSASQVLRVAAVAGRHFDFAVLAALTGQDDEALLASVRELIGAQLVVEESAERFAFRHALTRQAIYAGLLTRERRALHRAIAETLIRLHKANLEPHLADLARHFAEGEAWEEAGEYGERAGHQALALFAPGAATEHFDRALAASERLSTAPSARLLRARGQALATLGDFDGAQADFESVLTRSQSEQDRRAEWRALLDLGDLWTGRDYARAGGYFDQAHRLARGVNDPLMVAESLTHLGNWHLNREQPVDAEQCLAEALAIFEQEGDRHGVARTVDLLGTVSDIAGDIALMRRRYERAAGLFRALGDRQALSSTLATLLIAGGAYVFETAALPPPMPAAEALNIGEEALALARETGWRAGEAYALGNFALHFAAHGAYGQALASAGDALAIAREIDHREWMAASEWTHGMILAALLLPARAREHFQRAFDLGQSSGSWYWRHLTAATLAENHVALGELDPAAELLAEVAGDLPMVALGQRRLWMARAKLALARGDAAGALAIAQSLAGGRDIPLLTLLSAECVIALGRPEEVEASLRGTLRVAEERELDPLRWRSHLALGQVSAALGDVHGVVAHRRFARTIVDRLAESLPNGALRDEFLANATALPPSKRGRSAQGDGALTRREREVAALLTSRRSNRDIADQLSIGERTVETHVSHILAKLGLASRQELAARSTGNDGREPAARKSVLPASG